MYMFTAPLFVLREEEGGVCVCMQERKKDRLRDNMLCSSRFDMFMQENRNMGFETRII